MNLRTNVSSNTKTPTEDLTIDAYGFYVGSADKSFNVNIKFRKYEKNTICFNYDAVLHWY